jgi:hypothetical protein
MNPSCASQSFKPSVWLCSWVILFGLSPRICLGRQPTWRFLRTPRLGGTDAWSARSRCFLLSVSILRHFSMPVKDTLTPNRNVAAMSGFCPILQRIVGSCRVYVCNITISIIQTQGVKRGHSVRERVIAGVKFIFGHRTVTRFARSTPGAGRQNGRYAIAPAEGMQAGKRPKTGTYRGGSFAWCWSLMPAIACHRN